MPAPPLSKSIVAALPRIVLQTLIIFVVVGVGMNSAGCRSGRFDPLRRSMVKVTETPSDQDRLASDLDSPKQRLVSSDRNPSNPTSEQTPNRGSDAQRLARADRLVPRDAVPENRRVSLASAQLPADDKASLPRLPAGRKSPATDSANRTATKKNATKKNATNKNVDYESMMVAFESYPPAVRREAMRRLTATLAASATQSDQPGDTTAALTDQLDRLPPLPNIDQTSRHTATRVGESQPRVDRQSAQPSHWATAESSAGQTSESNTETKRSAETSWPTDPMQPQRRTKTTSRSAATTPPANETIPAEPAKVQIATLPAGAFKQSPTGIHPPKAPQTREEPQYREGSQSREGHRLADRTDRQRESTSRRTSSGTSPKTPPVSSTASTAVSPADNRSTKAQSTVAHPSHSVLQPRGDDLLTTGFETSTEPNESIVDADHAITQVAAIEDDPAADALATADDDALYDRLIKKLSVAPENETEAARSARMIKLRHLLVLSGKPDAASQQIEGMSQSEQDYLRHQLKGLWTMVDPNGHPVPRRRLAGAVKQIRQAAQHAAAGSDSLEVRGLSFCTAIEAYGQTTPFKSNRFKPSQQVILYCEVENFTADKTPQGYQTQLQGNYEVLDDDGIKVDGQLLPADRQVSAHYLRDYFIAYQMGLPSLSPGNYTLRLTIEDLNGKKYGQSEIGFTMTK